MTLFFFGQSVIPISGRNDCTVLFLQPTKMSPKANRVLPWRFFSPLCVAFIAGNGSKTTIPHSGGHIEIIAVGGIENVFICRR